MGIMLEPIGPEKDREPPLGQRLLWFAGLSLASVVVVAALAYALRALLFIG